MDTDTIIATLLLTAALLVISASPAHAQQKPTASRALPSKFATETSVPTQQAPKSPPTTSAGNDGHSKQQQRDEAFREALLYHEYPTNQRGSDFRALWGRRRDRAVSSADYEKLVKPLPDVDVGRVTQPVGVSGGTKPEATTPARSNTPTSVRTRDRTKTKATTDSP